MVPAPWRPMTRPAGREWTVEEAALFAARRDFELLRLLITPFHVKVVAAIFHFYSADPTRISPFFIIQI